MLCIISDASVLIDIEYGDLSKAMFKLPWQFAVPDILFAEELAARHEHLLNLGLQTKFMGEELITEAYALRQDHKKLSVNDLLALVLAKHEGRQLLTGDKALREIAKQLKVKVHGIIWLVGEMIHHRKISVDTARNAFQYMRNSGSRLPWDEVEKMLKIEAALTCAL